MKGGAFTALLTDCNHQLAIRCIHITQITLRVLYLASPNVGEG